MTVAGVPEGSTPVSLDASLFLPATTPAPAVVLAHGFGGSKDDVASQARSLAQQGFVVVTYSARGFGASGGLIHLDSPDYEVADARRVIDRLAAMPEVEKDGPGDPRVGVGGASYGGALALLAAGYDRRVDAVAADITWNDLSQALFPTAGGDTAGVFKQAWSGQLFSQAARQATPDGCGEFAPDVCAAYQASAAAGEPTAALRTLMQASSPSTILNRITVPTLLSQGQQDSLFPLDQAVRNAGGIRAPVRMVWRPGGHDQPGGDPTADAQSWFAQVLQERRTPAPGFSASVPDGSLSTETGRSVPRQLSGESLAAVQETRQVPMLGPPQVLDAPAGGTPTAITAVPGIGSLLSTAASVTGGASVLSAIPGQAGGFASAPLDFDTLVGGSSSVRLRVTPRTTTDALLFVSLVDVAPDGTRTQPSGLVTPVRLTGLTPGQATTVTVPLPTVVRTVAAGHRVAVQISTTDLGYRLPTDARSYTVGLDSPTLALTTLQGRATAAPFPWGWPVAGIVAMLLLVAGIVLAGWRRGRRVTEAAADDVPPIVVEDLVKEYGDSYRAVDGVSFSVERGQVVGLLGPNGAGKTTVLRMMVGLIRPTAGSIRLFGETVRPGSDNLARVGAFIEGPGLLPHLSGRDNLDLFWAATGRPREEADVETALEIAGLGASVDRKVRKYSQGMRQRLAIAQAMLGLPELLILDEPTNGLDPPQIAEMREVMRRYAATGRTVIVSSHLLSEVEQTCSHVVVMHKGRLVTAGSVSELAGAATSTLAVADVAAAQRVLADAGVDSTVIESRRHLEEAFLDLIGEESR